jgi:hypothetical protein
MDVVKRPRLIDHRLMPKSKRVDRLFHGQAQPVGKLLRHHQQVRVVPDQNSARLTAHVVADRLDRCIILLDEPASSLG